MTQKKKPSQSKRKSGKSARKIYPIVPATKITEAKSRTRLEEVLSPWLFNDIKNDFGIDGLIEITQPHPTDTDFDATGKRFAFQLKASIQTKEPGKHVEVRIQQEHIRYWLSSTEPVLLIFCHVPSGRLFWRWVDDKLIQDLTQKNASWIADDIVPITVPEVNLIDRSFFDSLEKFVRSYRGSTTKLLAPGTYIRLQSEVSQIAKTMLDTAQKTGFDSVISRLENLHKALLSNTYVVAVTGPARAGKSTLMNTLLGTKVSPVGQFPTTAVTLMIVGADKEEAEIFFEDETQEIGPASAEFVQQFATQENNPDNNKHVQRIVIRLVNEMLERGVAFVDAPGLYDPSEPIRKITANALDAAHAILYVLDISPVSQGGFSLNDHTIKHFKRLSKNHKHLFLVLNKVDVLTSEQREQAFQYIEATLKKYEIWNKLAHPPIFLSAMEGWSWREQGRKGEAPQKILDDALWNFLLSTNSTGINRLLESTTELKRACGDFLTLINARRLDGSQAFQLRQSLENCRQRQIQLLASVRDYVSHEKETVKNELPNGRQTIITNLNEWLSRFSINQILPEPKVIQGNIQQWLIDISSKTWTNLGSRLKNFAAFLSVEVEKALQQTRLSGGLAQNMKILLPPVPILDLSRTESFEEAWAGFFLGTLGFLVSGGFGLVLGIGGLFAGLIFGRESRRKRQVEKIIKKTNQSLDSIYQSLSYQIEDKISLYGKALEDQITDRIGVFINDAEKQLSKLGEAVTPVEQKEMESVETEIERIVSSLNDVEKQLSPNGLPSE